MAHISVDILDHNWPRLKVVVNRDGVVTQHECLYDVAFNNFEPKVRDAVRVTVDSMIRRRKGSVPPNPQGGE